MAYKRPDMIPTVTDLKGCVLQTITQPRAALQKRISVAIGGDTVKQSEKSQEAMRKECSAESNDLCGKEISSDNDGDDDHDGDDDGSSSSSDDILPLVAVHLRTGWADWTHRNAKRGWDALGECEEFRDIPTYAGATREGLGITDNDGKQTLPQMLGELAKAADSAFGTSTKRTPPTPTGISITPNNPDGVPRTPSVSCRVASKLPHLC